MQEYHQVSMILKRELDTLGAAVSELADGLSEATCCCDLAETSNHR
jgi:hypothetical protein